MVETQPNPMRCVPDGCHQIHQNLGTNANFFTTVLFTADR